MEDLLFHDSDDIADEQASKEEGGIFDDVNVLQFGFGVEKVGGGGGR